MIFKTNEKTHKKQTRYAIFLFNLGQISLNDMNLAKKKTQLFECNV